MPEIISRSKRPGSAFQNSFIQHSETSGTTTALMNKNDKKTNSTVIAKQKTTVTTATVEIENDIDQNPGNWFNNYIYLFQKRCFKRSFVLKSALSIYHLNILLSKRIRSFSSRKFTLKWTTLTNLTQ